MINNFLPNKSAFCSSCECHIHPSTAGFNTLHSISTYLFEYDDNGELAFMCLCIIVAHSILFSLLNVNSCVSRNYVCFFFWTVSDR